MNHHPIYQDIPPAFCFQPGDSVDSDAVIDCPICLERLARKDEQLRQEHFAGSIQEGDKLCR